MLGWDGTRDCSAAGLVGEANAISLSLFTISRLLPLDYLMLAIMTRELTHYSHEPNERSHHVS
jgi:hypothetical protein